MFVKSICPWSEALDSVRKARKSPNWTTSTKSVALWPKPPRWIVIHVLIIFSFIFYVVRHFRLSLFLKKQLLSQAAQARFINYRQFRYCLHITNNLNVLWCGRDLWDETAHSHLPCCALCRKTTPNKQRAAKQYKMAMNWAQITQKKQQQAQVCVIRIYFYIHAHISTF